MQFGHKIGQHNSPSVDLAHTVNSEKRVKQINMVKGEGHQQLKQQYYQL